MKLKWRLSLIGIALSFVGIGTALAATGPYGRDFLTGYFVGNPINYINWVFVPEGVTQYAGLGPGCAVACNVTLNSFLNVYHTRLFDTTALINRGRAAAEIDIMLGQPGTNFPTIQSGIDYAQAHYQEWADLVTLYADNAVPGYTVQWNDLVSFNSTAANPGTNGMGMYTVKGSGGSDMTCLGVQKCIGNISFTNKYVDNGIDSSVVFFDPSGNQFIIKHKCANLTGDFINLNIPPSKIDITKTSSHPAPIGIGTQMDYTIQAHEEEPIPLTNVTITDTIPSQFKYIGPVAGDPVPTVAGNTLTWTFAAPGDSTILNNIANGSETLGVVVQAQTAGNGIVNTAGGSGSSATDEFGHHPTINPGSTINTISPESTPVFTGENSDLQAGGGLCGKAQTNGAVNGNSSLAANDQYVVSASAVNGIFDFGSNSAQSGSAGDDLRLGSAGGTTGQYAKVCREDLLGLEAAPYYAANISTAQVVSGTNFDVTGKSGAWFFTPNTTVNVSGTVTNKVTLVALNGNVEITGNITIGPGSAQANATPSFGIIAAGNINISSAVTRVDAYLFADGVIDTCVQADGSCDQPLLVNGFLMGQNVLLHRLGPSGASGAPVAENIVMNPQIYLNPPMFFNASVDNVQLQGEGETQPLF